MKKLIIASVILTLGAVSCTEKRVDTGELVENYALVSIPAPDLSGISENGKEVLNLYRKAADEVDKIYWQQNFGDKETLLGECADDSERLYAEINYGPWDRIDGKAFLPGYGRKPAGARFYPSDMTAEEFAAFDDNIYSALKMLVIEKQGDIGTLRSMGAPEGLIRRIFLWEGWLVSLLGMVIGLVLGIMIVWLQDRFGLIAMPGNFVVQAYPVVLKATDILWTVVGVAGIGFLMALIPSRKL